MKEQKGMTEIATKPEKSAGIDTGGSSRPIVRPDKSPKKAIRLTPRGRRRKQNGKAVGKNKRALLTQARQRGYGEIIEKLGYSGSMQTSDLPRRWGGFNKPGVPK